MDDFDKQIQGRSTPVLINKNFVSAEKDSLFWTEISRALATAKTITRVLRLPTIDSIFLIARSSFEARSKAADPLRDGCGRQRNRQTMGVAA